MENGQGMIRRASKGRSRLLVVQLSVLHLRTWTYISVGMDLMNSELQLHGKTREIVQTLSNNF